MKRAPVIKVGYEAKIKQKLHNAYEHKEPNSVLHFIKRCMRLNIIVA